MPSARSVKSTSRELTTQELMRSDVSALNGVSQAAVDALRRIGIETVFDLATSPVFRDAARLSFPSDTEEAYRRAELLPMELLDDSRSVNGDPAHYAVVDLHGVSDATQRALVDGLGIETIRDLALWPPYLAARQLAGLDMRATDPTADPEIPTELVPKLNEHATEKSFYSIYAIDPIPSTRGPALNSAVDLAKLALTSSVERARTGYVLRYEQSWTPIALTLGNLLHSLALAPGESTRIALVDWTRRQGVRTTEAVSQLESLANTMVQNRSVNEVTRAVAREAQTGFSNVNANSTVSNSAYTSYGLQNAEEALGAGLAGMGVGAGAGATAGGVAGVGIGGVAGAIVGGVLLSETGPGALAGIAGGAAIGAFGGGLIGAGSGAVIGGAAGGAMGFMGTAEFGSTLDSGSNTTLDVVTTTASNGTREVESEMLQAVSDRTQQHSSNSRNRRASIVQEVNQSETEKVSTRVVTNYNHMHALTVQYFEVVQLYAVRTTLVRKQPCLYVPIQPIDRWTPELVRLFRDQILVSALTAEVTYSLITTAGTVALHSPTFPRVSQQFLREYGKPELIDKARNVLDSVVSTNPYDSWRLPEAMHLSWVFGIMETGGGGPFGGIGGPNAKQLSHKLVATMRSGRRREVKLGELSDGSGDPILLNELAGLEYVIKVRSGFDRDLADELDEPREGVMRLFFAGTDLSGDATFEDAIEFNAYYQYNAEMVQGDTLTIPIVACSAALSMEKLLQHLNENTAYYSRQIVKRRGNPLISKLLTQFTFGGQPLANVVDPDPVAVNGNNLVFLLHEEAAATASTTSSSGAGSTHAATGRTDRHPSVGSVRTEEIVPIGTGGVFAEAVQGRANAAERLDISRFWDWQDSPIPIVAPEIAPVTLGSRALPADVRPGGLDPAVLSPMSARGLPDPQGTAAVLATLQKELFRDMSGIAETAQLAQTALQEAMRGATESGGQVSENLQAGMEHTTAIVDKVLEMTGEYGNLLAEKGFGLLTDSAKAALGSAGGGGGMGGLGGLLGGGSSAGSVAAGIGPGAGATRSSSGTLGNRNASIAGALLNKAGGMAGSGATAGPAATNGAAGSGAATSNGATSGPADADFETSGYLESVPSLEERLLGEMGGLPPSGVPSSSNDPDDPGDIPPLDMDELVQSRLLPQLANASASDEEFFRATGVALDLMGEVAMRGGDQSVVENAAIPKLAPAWKAAIDRALADFNAGDLTAAQRIDELLAAGTSWNALMGATTAGDVLGMMDVSVQITDIQAPSEVVGGEEVTVTARVVQTLPDGTTQPAAGAQAWMSGLPMDPERLSATADDSGRITFKVRHGVPPENFAGVHRYSGWLDMELYLSAISTFSNLVSHQVKHVIPGKLAVTLTSAIYEDDGSDVLIGSVVHAHVGRKVVLEFRATKGGQALQGHMLTRADVSVNGTGLIDGVTSTDSNGYFVVEYLAPDASTDIAYVSPLVKLSATSEQAGMAQIQILGN